MSTNLIIHQGKTFQRVLRWESLPHIYKAISAISAIAPCRVTSATHGLVNGWRAAVVSVKGMEEINAKNTPPKDADYHKITLIDPNTIDFNDVNAADFTAYQSGGYLQYYTPVPLAGYSARMQIKNKIGGTVLKALVSPTDIVIDDTAKTITFTMSATDTALFAKGKYVYDFEMVSGTGVVTQLLSGEVTVIPEVTT